MAISEDTGSQPAAVHTSAGTPATTASFSPQAGTLLVAMIGTNGPSGTAVTATITDSLSGSWTLLKRQNTSTSMGGTAEIWCRYLNTAPGSMTVTGSWTGADTGANFVVRCLLGASPTQNGATAATGGSSIAPNTAISPTQFGSWVYGALMDWTASTTMVANSNTTIIDQFNDTTNGDTYAALKASASTSTLSSTSYGCTNVNAAFNIAFAEILAAPDPAPIPVMFLPVADFLGGIQPWQGAPDSDHSVQVNAGVASVTVRVPTVAPRLLLALSSETGQGATVQALSDIADPAGQEFLFLPNDVLGGIQPWQGAPDSAVSSAVNVNAGVASVTFTAQQPVVDIGVQPGAAPVTSTAQQPVVNLGVLPGAGAVTLTAQQASVIEVDDPVFLGAPLFLPDDPLGGMAPWTGAADSVAATAALAGVASVSLTAQTASTDLGVQPGAAVVTVTAQLPSAALGALPGVSTLTLTAQAPVAGAGALPGAAPVNLTALSPSTGLTAGPGVATVVFVGQNPAAGLGPSAGAAAVAFAGQTAEAGLGALPGTGSVSVTDPQDAAGLGALPGAAPVVLAGQTASTATVEDQQALPFPLFLPDDLTGGMAPWTGAPDGVVTGNASVGAGVAALILAAQPASTALTAGPGAAAVTLTAQQPSVSLSAFPGAAASTLTALTASTGLGVPAGSASLTLAGRTASAGLGVQSGTATVNGAASGPLITVASLPGVAQATLTARTPSTALTVLGTGTAAVTLTAQSPSAAFSGTASAGVATTTLTARSASTALAALPSAASSAVTARQPAAPLGFTVGTASVSLVAVDAAALHPQTTTVTSISGREPGGPLSGREYTAPASGSEPSGTVSGHRPVSSGSGQEPPGLISGREP